MDRMLPVHGSAASMHAHDTDDPSAKCGSDSPHVPDHHVTMVVIIKEKTPSYYYHLSRHMAMAMAITYITSMHMTIMMTHAYQHTACA